MTILEELVDRYPSAAWNWNQLSLNKAISMRFIADHKSFPWNSNNVSRNTSITEDDIIAFSDYQWNYSGLCSNPNLNYAFYKKNMIQPKEVLYVDWSALSANPSITTMDIIENPSNPWNDRFLSANPNITSTFILNEGILRKWHAPSISANPGIVKRDIVKSTLVQLFEWDYRNLSINKNLPLAYVNDNMNKNWNWFSISQNTSMLDIERFNNFKWNHDGLSMNTNISLKYAMNNKNIRWNKLFMLSNAAISLSDIYDNIDWFAVDHQVLKKHVSANPNITFQWVVDNINFIDWDKLSNNILI